MSFAVVLGAESTKNQLRRITMPTTQKTQKQKFLQLSVVATLALSSQSLQAADDLTFSRAMLQNVALTHLRNSAIADSILDSMTRKSFHSNYGQKTAVGELKEAEETIRNRDYDYEAIEIYVAGKVAKEKAQIAKLEEKVQALTEQHNALQEKATQVAIEEEKAKQKAILIEKAKVIAEQKAKSALQAKIQAHQREKARLAREESLAKSKAQAKIQAQEREQIANRNRQRDTQLNEQVAQAKQLQVKIAQAKQTKANLARTLEQERARIDSQVRQLQKEYEEDTQIKNPTSMQKSRQKERQREIANLNTKLKDLSAKTKQDSQSQDIIITNNERELAKVDASQKEIKSAYERDIASIKEQNKQEYQAQLKEIAKQYYLEPLDTKAELESLRQEHTQIEVAKAQNTEIKLPQASISAIQTRIKALYQQPNQGKNPEITQTKNQIAEAQKRLEEKAAYFTAQAKLEQDRQKQLELDSVRVDLSEVNKIRLKGVDLDKQDWTNQQILDALDRIFIPYYGDKKQHFFLVPYALHSYLNEKSSIKGDDIGGGVLLGIERNLGPLAGRIGGYVGYEFGYLNTTVEGGVSNVDTSIYNHGVNGGLTYFKPFATSGTNEWFFKTSLRGGGRFMTYNNVNIYGNTTTNLGSAKPDMIKAWNVGIDMRAGKKFYSVKRNSYFSPEFGISYDMLQTLKWDSVSVNGNKESIKEHFFHLPQARVQIHYQKAFRNTFKFSATLGGVYNILNTPSVSYYIDSNSTTTPTSKGVDLPAVYGVADLNAHWALKSNTEITFGYTGAYFSTAVSSAVFLKIAKWF